ncbi:MAG TPA: hypothetical protein VFO67_03135, partial [Gemmatimonadales bacterium]|nr:hypothetical protein [Gemmatimonadales bacterium]
TRSRLRELVSRGSARALTHHPPEPGDTIQKGSAINYSRGTRITVAMLRDRIENVVVAGKADGVHLEPLPPARADTTKPAAPPPPPSSPPSSPPQPPASPPGTIP